MLPEFREDRYNKMMIYRRCNTHGEFFPSENTDNLLKAMQSAFHKRGVPERLYVDNGAIYTCAEINQVCARLGTILSHAPIRDGAAKGKIERFFRNVRDKFLLQVLDMSSLKTLNDQFRVWVEEEYNAAVHGTLQMKPVDRFAMDLKRIRFLDPMDFNEELFFFEQERCVRKDMSIRTKKRSSPRLSLALCTPTRASSRSFAQR